MHREGSQGLFVLGSVSIKELAATEGAQESLGFLKAAPLGNSVFSLGNMAPDRRC